MPQEYTLVVEDGCRLEPLSQRFQSMRVAGDLLVDPIRVGERFRIVVASGQLESLRSAACVVEVVPGWQEVVEEVPQRPEFRLFSAMAANACQVKGTLEQPSATNNTGGISGTVTSEETGLPIAGIRLCICNFDAEWGGYGCTCQEETDSNGHYTIDGLEPGDYRVGFEDASNGNYISEYYDDAQYLETAVDVPVTGGSTTSGIDAALATAAHISGTITADDGDAPLPGIYAEAYRLNDSNWDYVNAGYTDSSGYYVIGGLPAGTYRIGFFDWENGDYVPEYYDDVAQLYEATDIVVAAGATSANKDAALATAAHITGTITAEDSGAPLQSIYVRAYRLDGAYWSYAGYQYSDNEGLYDLGGLTSGTYRLWFSDYWDGNYVPEYYDDVPSFDAATDIAVTAGETAVGKNAALATAGRISGTVTAEDGGAPLPGIDVDAYRFNGSYWTFANDGSTDSNGNFDTGGLPPGTYRIGFSDWENGNHVSEYYDNVPDLDGATDIAVAAGATAVGKNAALATAAHITGTITAEDGGAPLQNIAIEAYRFNGSNWDYVNYSYTDSSGYYDVGGLAAGSYRMGFFDWENGIYVSEFYDNMPDLDGATDIVVAAAETVVGKNAALATAGHITGTVTAETDGAPLQDIDVVAYAYDGFDWVDVAYGYTDAYGQYDIGGLTAGIYRVGFFDWYNGAHVGKYYVEAVDVSEATDVSVSAGTVTSGIDAALTDAGFITGTVTAESDGSPLNDIVVWLYRFVDNEWVYLESRWTDGSGWYEFGGLAEGTYRVEYYDWYEVYVGQVYDNAASLDEGTDILVVPGEVAAGIDGSLVERGSIGGTVTVAATGSPLANVDVGAWTFNGTTWDYLKSGYSDENGDYLITGLLPGVYRVDFIDSEGLYQYEFYDDAPDVTSATDVVVDAATTTWGIDAALDLPSASPFSDCVSNTGNDATVAIPAAVVIDGLVLEAGDEFALYTPDGTICAGHGLWDGGSLGITAWGDDEQITPDVKDGFTDGEQMMFRIWDASADELHALITPTYSQGTGLYSPNSMHVVGGLDVQAGAMQQIPLAAGWNMISSYVDPAEPELETLLAGIEDDMVLLKDDSGGVYWPSLPLNSIGDWDVHKGYQIYMSSPAILVVAGTQVDPAQTPIELLAGWSLIAYLRDTPLAIDQALDSISGQLVLAKNGTGQVYWPAYGVNQIGDMQPGAGYQVYLTGAGTLVYSGD